MNSFGSQKKIVPGGLLIAIEGIDGGGKTTLADALLHSFESAGVRVHKSKEPTFGPWGMKVRNGNAEGRLDAEEEVRYLILDRQQHVNEVIKPELSLGGVVILDRYYPSTAAYQGAAGQDVDRLLEMNSFAPVPDVIFVLDIDPATGLDRIRGRGDVPNIFETTETLTRCRELFLSMPLSSRRVIDASGTVESVLREAWKVLLVVIADKAAALRGFSPEAADLVLDIGGAIPNLDWGN
jgi:dTMP kinase